MKQRLCTTMFGLMALLALCSCSTRVAGLAYEPVQHVGYVNESIEEPGIALKTLRWIAGQPSYQELLQPVDMAMDQDGGLWVCDLDAGRILVYPEFGCAPERVRRVGAERLTAPSGIEMMGDRLAIADAGRGHVGIYTPGLRLLEGLVAPEAWIRPGRMYFDGERLFVTDAPRHVVEVFDASGKWQQSLTGMGDECRFRFPLDVCADGQGGMWVLDAMNHRMCHFDSELNGVGSFGNYDQVPGSFLYPKSLALGPDGSLYISDAGSCRIQVFSQKGALLYWFGGPGQGQEEFLLPGTLLMKDDFLFIADVQNRRIDCWWERSAQPEQSSGKSRIGGVSQSLGRTRP